MSPSQLPKSQEQPSSQEQDIPQPEQVPPIEQVHEHFSPAPVLQEVIEEIPSVPSEEAQPAVSLPDTHVPAPTVQVPIEEPLVHSVK